MTGRLPCFLRWRAVHAVHARHLDVEDGDVNRPGLDAAAPRPRHIAMHQKASASSVIETEVRIFRSSSTSAIVLVTAILSRGVGFRYRRVCAVAPWSAR